MKHSNIQSVLHTDVRTLLHRLCFAVCPPRVCWPADHHEDYYDFENPDAAPYSYLNASVLLGNSVFWSPTWGHTAILGSTASQPHRETGRSEKGLRKSKKLQKGKKLPRCQKSEKGHAVGHR